MDIKSDYVKRLSKERENFKEKIADLRDSHKEDLSIAEDSHEDRVQTQRNAHLKQKKSLEENVQKAKNRYEQALNSGLEEQNQAYVEKLKTQAERAQENLKEQNNAYRTKLQNIGKEFRSALSNEKDFNTNRQQELSDYYDDRANFLKNDFAKNQKNIQDKTSKGLLDIKETEKSERQKIFDSYKDSLNQQVLDSTYDKQKLKNYYQNQFDAQKLYDLENRKEMEAEFEKTLGFQKAKATNEAQFLKDQFGLYAENEKEKTEGLLKAYSDDFQFENQKLKDFYQQQFKKINNQTDEVVDKMREDSLALRGTKNLQSQAQQNALNNQIQQLNSRYRRDMNQQKTDKEMQLMEQRNAFRERLHNFQKEQNQYLLDEKEKLGNLKERTKDTFDSERDLLLRNQKMVRKSDEENMLQQKEGMRKNFENTIKELNSKFKQTVQDVILGTQQEKEQFLLNTRREAYKEKENWRNKSIENSLKLTDSFEKKIKNIEDENDQISRKQEERYALLKNELVGQLKARGILEQEKHQESLASTKRDLRKKDQQNMVESIQLKNRLEKKLSESQLGRELERTYLTRKYEDVFSQLKAETDRELKRIENASKREIDNLMTSHSLEIETTKAKYEERINKLKLGMEKIRMQSNK